MMKLRLLSLVALSSIAISSYAESSQDLQDQAQINALQSQIEALQNQIQNLNASNIPASTPLSQLIMLDTSKPFGYMFDTNQPQTILQTKPTFNTPIVLGGDLEADAEIWNGSFSTTAPNGATYQKGSDLYLTSANLFVMANVNSWVTGFASFTPNVGGALNSSSVIDRAFLIVGNLQKSPWYLIVGKGYLPFGLFGGNGAYANSLDTNAFRTSGTNQISLNYDQYGLSINLAGFSSGEDSTSIDDFAYNMAYNGTVGGLGYGVGAGYIQDIRKTNSGIGAAYPANINGSRNAAFDLNGSLSYGEYMLYAQYDTTERGANETAANQYVGRMSAWNLTAYYSPTLWNTLTMFHISYSGTRNMGTIPFPLVGMIPQGVETAGAGTNNDGLRTQLQLGVTSEIITNVYIGPEFDYQHLYNSQNTWAVVYDVMAYF